MHIALSKFVAELRGQFILLLGHGVVQLFMQSASNLVVVTQRFAEIQQFSYQFVVLKHLADFVFVEQLPQFVQPTVDLVDRALGGFLVQMRQCGRLNAMKHDKRAVLFV